MRTPQLLSPSAPLRLSLLATSALTTSSFLIPSSPQLLGPHAPAFLSHSAPPLSTLPPRLVGASAPQLLSSLRMTKDDDKSSKLTRFLDRMEAKSARMEERAARKLQKLENKLARFKTKRRFRSKTKELVKEAKKKPVVYALAATGGVMITIPAISLVATAIMSAFSMFFLIVQMTGVLLAPAAMFLTAGAHLLQPSLVATASVVSTAVTLALAAVLAGFKRSRSLHAIILGTVLPFVSLWLAAIPTKSFAIVQSMRVLDPLRPLIADPFFRPLIPDIIFSDVWEIVPNPFLIEGPIKVVVASTTATPYFAAKAAVSVMALAVAAWCWYRERNTVTAALEGVSNRLSPAPAVPTEARALTKEEEEDFQEEARVETLKAWENTFDISPKPVSKDPVDWSVDDLATELTAAGLEDCVESFRKARIDGKVALTLTKEDEDEIRQEMGINRLGQRRRLMIFLDDLRRIHKGLKSDPEDPKPSSEDLRPQPGI